MHCCHRRGRAGARPARIGLNFTGVTLTQGAALNGGTLYAPPDSDGAVGPNDIVQLINGAFVVYDKTANHTPLLTESARTFWALSGNDPGNSLSGLGIFNQRIIYDPTTQRWIAAGLTGDTTNNSILLARSDTSDPTGSWHSVAIPGNVGGPGQYVDYTRLGIDANGVYISTNNYTSNPGFSTDVSVFSLPKADLLATNPTLANLTRFDGQDPGNIGMSIQPVINFGPNQGFEPLLATSLASPDTVLYRTDLVGTAAANATMSSTVQIGVNQYFNPPAAGQSNGSQIIGTIDQRFTGNVYQVGNVLYAVHATRVETSPLVFHDAITWYKIDATTNNVLQEGTITNGTFDLYQPSIAANEKGDVVISYNQSGTQVGGQIRIFAVVGKTDSSGITTFGTPIQLQVSTTGAYSFDNGRWGDYTTTVVDPSNPNVFWAFQEYALRDTNITGNDWATQITQITVPEPESLALAAIALASLALTAWRRRRPAAGVHSLSER